MYDSSCNSESHKPALGHARLAIPRRLLTAKRSPAYNQQVGLGAHLILILLFAFLFGCSEDNTGPPPLMLDQRETIKQNLIELRAKVTADIPEALYLSLRNTHVEIRELGGTIDGTYKRRRDIQDFGEANEAVARGVLSPDEFEEFKRWLHEALSPKGSTQRRAEFKEYKVSLSRNPLRMVFTRRSAPEPE